MCFKIPFGILDNRIQSGTHREYYLDGLSIFPTPGVFHLDAPSAILIFEVDVGVRVSESFKKHSHSVCTLHDVMGSRSGFIFVFFLSHGDILQLWQCVLTPWSVHKGVLVPKATPSKIIMLKESSMLLISSLSVLSGVVLEGSVNSCWKNPHRLLCFEAYCSHGSDCKDSVDVEQAGEEPFCTCSTAFSVCTTAAASAPATPTQADPAPGIRGSKHQT